MYTNVIDVTSGSTSQRYCLDQGAYLDFPASNPSTSVFKHPERDTSNYRTANPVLFAMVLRSSNSPLTSELDALVQQQMDKWKVPGLSMAVVHGSSTWSKVGMETSMNQLVITDH